MDPKVVDSLKGQHFRQVACGYERMCLKTTRTPSENVAVVQAHLDLNLDLNPTRVVGKVVL